MRVKTALALATVILTAAPAVAQVRIRAPFVRVDVNGGVYVRAPFVNLYVPGSPPPIYVAPPPAFVPPAPTPVEPEPPANVEKPRPLPPAPGDGRDAPPPVVGKAGQLSVEDFAKSFKPKAGNYEVEIVNPVTRQPTTVRFTLPEGTPRRVHVSAREIEFDYGPRRYVKIQFDGDGAVVISR
jgi:hypothetical protein